MQDKSYIAIDLKSFYASVECQERRLDPMTTNLVVADEERTDKTICLAVSPSLKSYGVSSRPRLFQVNQRVDFINAGRRRYARRGDFTGSSYDINDLNKNKDLKIDFIKAKPQMAKYIEISSQIYNVYQKWIGPEDIYVYSIDEVFMDVTGYLKSYKMSAEDLAMNIILDVLEKTGITATVGIGTNMYLAKIAMDILAKKQEADENGVRIACLDEMSYRHELWDHEPITDFWRVGKGYAKRLAKLGVHTMGDVARMSINNEDILYDTFGINAELLIDHAWGYEPCTIKDVKEYKPKSSSISNGQVLQEPYPYDKAKVVVKEMADVLGLELLEKGLVTKKLVLSINYDGKSLEDKNIDYRGKIRIDSYGRKVPARSRGTINLNAYTSSSNIIIEGAAKLFEDICDKRLYIRKLSIVASNTISERDLENETEARQLDLFTDYNRAEREEKLLEEGLEKERRIQAIALKIKEKYGKNAILRAMNFREGATGRQRNNQIGGHRS